MKKEYGYMIKSVDISKDKKYGLGLRGFKYPLKKGAKVVAKDWKKEPVCSGGIFGLVHETKNHYILDKPLWVILKYEKGTEVVVDDSKIKVPYAWVEDWGYAAKIQSKFKELTGKEYQYDYAIQTSVVRSTQTAGNASTQRAGDASTQTAGNASTQRAGDASTQTAGNASTQRAGDASTQTAGYASTQTAGNASTQRAGDASTQTAGNASTQRAGDASTQTAGNASTQTAGVGSISIIRGRVGFCKHIGNGNVLQVLYFYDFVENDYIFLTKIINDNKKHKLEAIREDDRWILKDMIIE